MPNYAWLGLTEDSRTTDVGQIWPGETVKSLRNLTIYIYLIII